MSRAYRKITSTPDSIKSRNTVSALRSNDFLGAYLVVRTLFAVHSIITSRKSGADSIV